MTGDGVIAKAARQDEKNTTTVAKK